MVPMHLHEACLAVRAGSDPQGVAAALVLGEEAGSPGALQTALPAVRQQTASTCGPASLRSVLLHFGERVKSERELARSLGTTRAGTSPGALVRTARRRGLGAERAEQLSIQDLAAALARGEVPIVDYQAWPSEAQRERGGDWRDRSESGHYAAVQAVGPTHVSLMDPSTRGGTSEIAHGEFLRRWHDRSGRRGERHQRSAVLIGPPRPR